MFFNSQYCARAAQQSSNTAPRMLEIGRTVTHLQQECWVYKPAGCPWPRSMGCRVGPRPLGPGPPAATHQRGAYPRARSLVVCDPDHSPQRTVLVCSYWHDPREGVMGRRTLRELQNMSPKDQQEFNKWLKVNAVGGSIIAVGMLAMALAGTHSTRHTDTATAPAIAITAK
jgi:hypothetical protein